MSIVLSSSDRATRASTSVSGASGEKSVLIALKRTADSGGAEVPLDMTDAGGDRDEPFEVTSGDRNLARFSGFGTTADYGPNPVPTDGTWIWYYARFAGNDSFATYWMVEGAGSWTNGVSGTGSGFADKTIVNLTLGALADTSAPYTGECALLKIWNIDISAAQILTNLEHQYRNPQQNLANCRGSFAFRNNAGAALGTDDSGVGDLTLVSAPAYSADEPSDILGDNPVEAPTLSSPTAAKSGSNACTGTVSTDEDNGTLYWVVSTSNSAPSAAQIEAGQMHTGAAAAASGSQAVSASGVQNISDNGLVAATQYYIHYLHEDADDNDSNIVTSAAFTTDAAAVSDTRGVRAGPAFVRGFLRNIISRYAS